MDAKKIIENLHRAYEILDAVPETNFSLDSYHRETSCGTIMCAYGWLSTTEFFQKQGIRLREHDSGRFDPPDGICDRLDNIFGPDAWVSLFSTKGASWYDTTWHNEKNQTDKQLALLRIKRQLQRIEPHFEIIGR